MTTTFMQTNCDLCKEGRLEYKPGRTFESYCEPFSLEKAESSVDGIIEEFLVYECKKCGAVERLTYKEIEKRERRRITQLVMNSAARKEMQKDILSMRPKVLVYCGKCMGMDGKGSCLIQTYRECKIKRFPNEL